MGIRACFLKKHKDSLAASTAHITNLSLGSGVFPSTLKSAIITPIFLKSGDRHDIANYRPRSKLPVTEMACCYFLEFIRERMDKGGVVGGVFFFFWLYKAFDMVSHSVLLSKLNKFKLKSYLADCTQCVKMKNDLSSFQSCDMGVSQGSLGPILFYIYIKMTYLWSVTMYKQKCMQMTQSYLPIEIKMVKLLLHFQTLYP